MTAATPYPSNRSASFALAVAASLGFLMSIDQGLTGLLLEPMKRDMGLTDVQVGFAHSTPMWLSYALLSIPVGILADRSGRARLLVGATAIWIASMLLAGLCRTIPWLVASRIGLGAANATIYPAALSLLADCFRPERRGSATGIVAASRVAGAAFALLAGGAILGALERLAVANPAALFGLAPWRLLFLLFGAAALFILVATFFLREPQRQEIGDIAGGRLAELWRYRIFLLPLLVGMMFEGGATAIQATWTAPLLQRIYRLQPADFTMWLGPLTLACGLIGAAVGTMLSNLAQRRATDGGSGPRRMLASATVGALISVPAALYSLAPGPALLAGLFAIVSLTSFVVIVIVVIVINLHIPNELRGMVLALQVVTAGLSGALSPGLVAIVGRALGGDLLLGRAMALVAAPCWLAAAGCYWLAGRSDRHISR